MTLHHKVIGHGPPLIILHGLFGSLDNWMSIAKHLSRHFTVYLVDLRNHGQSFHDDQFSYQIMAGDLENLADALGIGKYAIIGHSMGGKVAMFAAAQNAGIVQLVIVDIGPKEYPIHHQQILDGLSSLDPEKLTSRGQADEMLERYIPEPAVRQFLLKNLKRNSNGSFQWKMNLGAIRDKIDTVGDPLPDTRIIEIPTLFIRGGSSNYILDEDFDSIANQFPQSRMITVPGAGHWIHAEYPQIFLETVLSFLGQN